MSDKHAITFFVGADQGAAFADTLILARHYRRQGHAVTVVGQLPRQAQDRLTQLEVRWVNLPLPQEAGARPWLTVAGQLRRLLRQGGPHLLHTQGVTSATVAAWATVHLGARTVRVAGLPDLAGFRRQGVWPWLSGWALGRAQALTVTTEADLALVRQLQPRALPRARVVHHAVEVRPTSGDFDVGLKRRALGVSPHASVIGVVGPALRTAGLETFLEAARRVSHDYPNVEFLLVGDGPDQEALQLRAHQMGLSGATIFRGDRVDLPEVIGALNILVIPHETPGAIRNALQAVVQEIPLVAVQSPALAETLEGLCPEALVPVGDAAALGAALARNLELLPPAEGEGEMMVEGGITLNYSDLLVSREAFDLDATGLQPQDRGEEPRRQAAQRALDRFSPSALIRATEQLYAATVPTWPYPAGGRP